MASENEFIELAEWQALSPHQAVHRLTLPQLQCSWKLLASKHPQPCTDNLLQSRLGELLYNYTGDLRMQIERDNGLLLATPKYPQGMDLPGKYALRERCLLPDGKYDPLDSLSVLQLLALELEERQAFMDIEANDSNLCIYLADRVRVQFEQPPDSAAEAEAEAEAEAPAEEAAEAATHVEH